MVLWPDYAPPVLLAPADSHALKDQPRPRIDTHVHAFPDRLALAVREALNRAGSLRAGPLLFDVAQGVRDAGFDAAWILPYAHRAGIAESVNEWSARECRRFPWLVPGATFHPEDEAFERLVERALVELGLRAVKLHCSVGNFAATDRRLEPLWLAAARFGVPVVIHAGRGPGQTGTDEIDALIPLLRAHPGLPLVLAHCGFPHSARALELMADYPNLYADLTPVWESAVQVTPDEMSAFAGRLLFGSDAPNNPVDAREQAARIEALGLEPETLALTLGGAAYRLAPLE